MPAEYLSFFSTIAEASATLLGLLFVSLSIDVGLENEFRVRQFALSETAFVSLGGIFIIALLALLPSGLVLAAGGGIGLSFAGVIDLGRIQKLATRLDQPLDVWYITATIGTYGCLAACSTWLLVSGKLDLSLHIFCGLLVILSLVSLVRAWRALLINKRSTPST